MTFPCPARPRQYPKAGDRSGGVAVGHEKSHETIPDPKPFRPYYPTQHPTPVSVSSGHGPRPPPLADPPREVLAMPGRPRVTQTKTPLESKTLWFAVLTALAAAANSLTDTVSDPQVLSGALAAQAFLTGILRWITTKPLDR